MIMAAVERTAIARGSCVCVVRVGGDPRDVRRGALQLSEALLCLAISLSLSLSLSVCLARREWNRMIRIENR